MTDLIERLRGAAADAAAEEYGVSGLLAEAAEALEAARADAERWRELCRQIDADEIHGGIFDDAKHMGAGVLEMHIDDAREARNG